MGLPYMAFDKDGLWGEVPVGIVLFYEYLYIYIMNTYCNFPKRLSKTCSLCLFFL